jgi:hypothetical protein
MRHLFILVLLLFIASNVFAQNLKFRAATVTLNKADPKTGWVAAEFFVGAPKGLFFKVQENDKAEFLKIETIKEVQLTDAERYLVYCDAKANNTCHWLETLLQGQISLYHSASDPEIYFLEEDNIFSPIRSNSLSGVVNLMKQKCAGFNPPAGISLNSPNLVNLVKSYNQCKNPQAAESKTMYHQFKQSFFIGPKVGVDMGRASMYKGVNYAPSNFKMNTTMGFGLALHWQMGARWSALTSLNFLSRTLSTDSINIPPFEDPNFANVLIKLSFIEVPLYVQYQFVTGKISPFVQAGLHAGVGLRSGIAETLLLDYTVVYDQPIINRFRSPAFGYGLGLGMNFDLGEKKRLQVLVNRNQYDIPLVSFVRHYSSYSFKTVSFPRTQVGLSYLWKL